jgi:hypothetical protein
MQLRKGSMADELEKIWKEAAMTQTRYSRMRIIENE